MSKSPKNPPKEKIDLFDRLIDTHPDIERKGVSNPYTSHNGHMFSHLSIDGTLGIRLPKEERDAFLKKYDTSLYESHGAIMKEYVSVPDELLQNPDELSQYLTISYEYIKTLKPKPTKKKS